MFLSLTMVIIGSDEILCGHDCDNDEQQQHVLDSYRQHSLECETVTLANLMKLTIQVRLLGVPSNLFFGKNLGI